MHQKVVLLVILFLSVQRVLPQDRATIPALDRIRLTEAFEIGEKLGDQIWKSWSQAPFAVLLITPEYEFLVRHPRPSDDFTFVGHDSLLKSDVYVRKRSHRIDFLATFPAIEGSIVPTIVVGQAESTAAKTSTPWVVTLLHEHFHQLQMSQADYFSAVEALDLSRGDQAGMWMLNFPFPYDSADVQKQFSDLSTLLASMLQTDKRSEASTKLAGYLERREKFHQLLRAESYKYFSFQLWQEGIARYTEYAVAALAAFKHQPGREFRALKDFTSFARVAHSLREKILKDLRSLRLGVSQRTVFYPFGAAEGLLLDALDPHWQNHYFEDTFFLEKYFSTTSSR